jgi:hypothetical protein
MLVPGRIPHISLANGRARLSKSTAPPPFTFAQPVRVPVRKYPPTQLLIQDGKPFLKIGGFGKHL